MKVRIVKQGRWYRVQERIFFLFWFTYSWPHETLEGARKSRDDILAQLSKPEVIE